MCILRAALVLAVSMTSGVARADSWAPPGVQVEASASGGYLVRVEPGRREPGLARAMLYRHDAVLESYVRQVAYPLPYRLAPVDILLTDDGALVIMDEWGEVGRGVVLYVHDAAGKLIHNFTLQELLGDAAVAAPSTIGSTWWRCGKPSLIAGGRVVHVTTYDNGELRLDLETGQVRHEPSQGRCQ